MAGVGHNAKMVQPHVETIFWYGLSFSVLFIMNYVTYFTT